MTHGDLPLTLQITMSTNLDDDVEYDRLTQQLRRRLLELDVERVQLVRTGQGPLGAKSADAVAQGALLVTLAPIALTGVLGLIQTWLGRNSHATVELTLPGKSVKVTGARRADTELLLREFAKVDDSAAGPLAGPNE